jgi:hypothetical protein
MSRRNLCNDSRPDDSEFCAAYITQYRDRADALRSAPGAGATVAL